jgi:heme-degrading monooxygenase HmoA
MEAATASQRNGDTMITEHALLPVRHGSEESFEAAFAAALPLIAATPGFRGASLSRCLERPNHYLLLVGWDTLDDHTVGFRGSPRYTEWSELLHHFYDPFPEVLHLELVSST